MDKKPAAGPAAHAKESRWTLTPAEQRTLVITFAGGLGAIIAGALIVGGAIALARAVRPAVAPGNWWAAVLVTAVYWASLPAAIFGWRRRRGNRWWWGLAIVAFFMASAVMLLMWVGLAAGVR